MIETNSASFFLTYSYIYALICCLFTYIEFLGKGISIVKLDDMILFQICVCRCFSSLVPLKVIAFSC